MLTPRKRQLLGWSILVGLVVMAATWASLSEPNAYGQICESNQQTDNKDCATYHMALVALWHVGKFLDAWEGAFLVLSTIAVAAFTFTLSRSTKKLWESTNRAAEITERAFTQLEGPLIECSKFESNMPIPGVPGTAGPIEELQARVWFKNRGHGPGAIFEVLGRFIFLEGEIPPEPIYPPEKRQSAYMSVAAGEELRDFIAFNLEITEDGEPTGKLFLYGYIKYRGLVGGVTTYGFAYMANKKTLRFDVRGGPAYNYRKYESED